MHGKFKSWRYACLVLAAWIVSASAMWCAAQEAGETAIEPRLIHLRSDPTREWSSFPEQSEGQFFDKRFQATANKQEFALRLRQQDVKQAWRVLLNGRPLGELVRDEADLMRYLPIAKGGLVAGENTLRIESTARGPQSSDDILVGELRIVPRPVSEVLGQATLEIEVLDAESMLAVPCRITIAEASGARHATSASSGERLAVREGVLYTADGKGRCGLPAGKYTVYAGRGFEYSLAQSEVTLAPGETRTLRLTIRREVPTPGYVACDTHIHTVTFSGHGDATIDERMITLAGEGIELPIATDHNVHVDYEAHARRLGVRQHFTPVMGNEVTTPSGHFNIFPIAAGARVPNHRSKEWPPTLDEIFATPGVKVAILNHARDLHSGTRPFGPALFNAATGQLAETWPARFTAMEVINSGASQTDPLRLVHDWMALLNRGYRVTPVGSSDSHDVARYIVGQGRTYIRVDDRDPGNLDVDTAVANFLQGRVMVSYGLLTELTVNGKYTCGDLAAPAGDEIDLAIRVLGPHWTTATQVQLFANGQLVRQERISPPPDRSAAAGLQWQATWKMARPKHDVHLVAVATGKGIDGPFWTTAKPYQPTSPEWESKTLGVSGAVWLDADGDGRWSSAREYAERAVANSSGELDKLVKALEPYDAAVAAQAAHGFVVSGGALDLQQIDRIASTAKPATTEGFHTWWKAWRDQQLTQAAK